MLEARSGSETRAAGAAALGARALSRFPVTLTGSWHASIQAFIVAAASILNCPSLADTILSHNSILLQHPHHLRDTLFARLPTFQPLTDHLTHDYPLTTRTRCHLRQTTSKRTTQIPQLTFAKYGRELVSPASKLPRVTHHNNSCRDGSTRHFSESCSSRSSSNAP